MYGPPPIKPCNPPVCLEIIENIYLVIMDNFIMVDLFIIEFTSYIIMVNIGSELFRDYSVCNLVMYLYKDIFVVLTYNMVLVIY